MVKRSLDIFISVIALFLLSPIILLLIILLYFFIGEPIFFVQDRVGKNGRIFKIIKFRTMSNDHDAEGKLLSDDYRLTKVGKLLRATSLDELPELINVLNGDMSIVGPRPLLIEYIPLYNKEQWRRHEVRPGITGLAQINGRNSISWEEKFSLDVWYVDHHNLWLDLKILFLTVKKVFCREGISSLNHVTMKKFTGNNKL